MFFWFSGNYWKSPFSGTFHISPWCLMWEASWNSWSLTTLSELGAAPRRRKAFTNSAFCNSNEMTCVFLMFFNHRSSKKQLPWDMNHLFGGSFFGTRISTGSWPPQRSSRFWSNQGLFDLKSSPAPSSLQPPFHRPNLPSRQRHLELKLRETNGIFGGLSMVFPDGRQIQNSPS